MIEEWHLINPDGIDVFETMREAAQLMEIPCNSMQDIPKLIEAFETWGKFEAAEGALVWFKYLTRVVEREMSDVTDASTTEG